MQQYADVYLSMSEAQTLFGIFGLKCICSGLPRLSWVIFMTVSAYLY